VETIATISARAGRSSPVVAAGSPRFPSRSGATDGAMMWGKEAVLPEVYDIMMKIGITENVL
jgi:hypothetical protein